MSKVKWLSDCTCDFCKMDATKAGNYFVDGKTKYGPWALMCKDCYAVESFSVGVFKLGLAQKYDSKTKEKIA